MFKNPGKALKTFGKVYFWTFVVVGTFFGIVAGANNAEGFVLIPASLGAASLIALPIYAFGCLVENLEIIKTAIQRMEANNEDRPNATPDELPEL